MEDKDGRDHVILTGTILEILLASTEEVRKFGPERASARARSWTFSRVRIASLACPTPVVDC